MQIHGMQKLTLLDYPGKVACTLFLGNCNFRCPFCQNAGLVLYPDKEPVIPTREVLSFLKKRQGILDGVCITGGEPTCSQGLAGLISDIKAMGYQIKLDTNGSRPQVVKDLVQEHLIDYVAMDIKNSPGKYAVTCGVETVSVKNIRETVDFLLEGNVAYEFRTTVCRELHNLEDFSEIGEWLQSESSYYLQGYQESANVIRPIFSGYSYGEMKDICEYVQTWLPNTKIRGIGK